MPGKVRLQSVGPAALIGAVVLGLAIAGALWAQDAGPAEAALAGWYELRPAEPDGKTPFAVMGWAVASCGAPEVKITVDGEEAWRATPSTAWPGVAEKYPDFEGAAYAGFLARIDPLAFAEGPHGLGVAVEACGHSHELRSSSFRTAPPTSPWVAWPLLVLILGVCPAIGGAALARLETKPSTLAALIPGVGLLLAALILVVVGARHLGTSVIEVESGLFAPLANWDGRFYLHIATEGYSIDQSTVYGFFPLYPLSIRLVSFLPLPLPLLGSLINAGLFVLFVVLLRRLYPQDDRGIAILACSPFAYFFIATYTETIALATAASFLLLLRRGRPGWAFALGVAAGLTRISGLLVALFALDFLRQKRWKEFSTCLAAPITGFDSWTLWLWRTTGDPLKYAHAQAEFGRSTTFHPGRLFDLLANAARSGPGLGWWELFFLFLVLTGAAALAARGRWGEAAYSAATVLLPVATLRLASLNRYALVAFPVYLWLGGLTHRRWIFRTVLAVEIGLLFWYAAQFGQQYWTG